MRRTCWSHGKTTILSAEKRFSLYIDQTQHQRETETMTSLSSDKEPQFEPLVILEEVAVVTGEEEEEPLCTMRAKLYVFIKEDVYGGEQRKEYWKERGLGDVKILRHKSNNTCRLLMRQEKTLKVCANCSILPESKLSESSNNRSWVFNAYDTPGTILPGSEEEEGAPELLQYAIKFKTEDIANEFKANYEKAQEINASPKGGKDTEATVDESSAKATGGAEATGDDIDAMIRARNRAKQKRRSIVIAENALLDSDYDSDEEDVDESSIFSGNKASTDVDDVAKSMEKVSVTTAE